MNQRDARGSGATAADTVPFDPSDWPVAWMARIERQHARNASALLAPLGLHHREFRLMAMMGLGDGLQISELSQRAVLERPTVSKMIDRMVAEGWVERGEDPKDRRRSPLRLTRQGRAKLAAARPIVEGLFRHYESGLDPALMRRLVSELRTFYERVRAAQAELGSSADESG